MLHHLGWVVHPPPFRQIRLLADSLPNLPHKKSPPSFARLDGSFCCSTKTFFFMRWYTALLPFERIGLLQPEEVQPITSFVRS